MKLDWETIKSEYPQADAAVKINNDHVRLLRNVKYPVNAEEVNMPSHHLFDVSIYRTKNAKLFHEREIEYCELQAVNR
jgi:hypothetical protein